MFCGNIAKVQPNKILTQHLFQSLQVIWLYFMKLGTIKLILVQ